MPLPELWVWKGNIEKQELAWDYFHIDPRQKFEIIRDEKTSKYPAWRYRMQIHYFQRYYAKENVETANTMLMLSRLYQYSADKFFSMLTNLILGEE